MCGFPSVPWTPRAWLAGIARGTRQDHAGGRQVDQGRLPAAERLQLVRSVRGSYMFNLNHCLQLTIVSFLLQVLSVLQDCGYDAQHLQLLRPSASRGRVDGSDRQQDHVGGDSRGHARHHVQVDLHEVQGQIRFSETDNCRIFINVYVWNYGFVRIRSKMARWRSKRISTTCSRRWVPHSGTWKINTRCLPKSRNYFHSSFITMWLLSRESTYWFVCVIRSCVGCTWLIKEFRYSRYIRRFTV